jgi:hypothetical protein
MAMISMTEAAKRLGIHRSTLWRQWRVMGLLFVRPAPHIRRWVIYSAEVDHYVRNLHGAGSGCQL